MSKYAAVVAATQPMIDYMDAIDAGNRELAERKYQDAMRGLDVLESSSRIARTKQTMRLESQTGARAEALFPSKLGLAETQAESERFALEQDKAEAQREAVGREQLRLVMSRPEIQEVLPPQLRNVMPENMAALGEAFGGMDSALTFFAGLQQKLTEKEAIRKAAEAEAVTAEMLGRKETAEAERPLIPERVGLERAEIAAGKKVAEYKEKMTQADIQRLPLDIVAKRREAELAGLQAQLAKGVTWDELGHLHQMQGLKRKALQARITLDEKTGNLRDAQAAKALLKEVTGTTEEIKAVQSAMRDLMSAYNAIKSMERGEDVLDQIIALRIDPGALDMNTATTEQLRDLLYRHVGAIKSLINWYGWEYDIESMPPVLRKLNIEERLSLPGGGLTTTSKMGVKGMQRLPQALQKAKTLDKGISSAWDEGEPPAPATEAEDDLETMLDAIFGGEQ